MAAAKKKTRKEKPLIIKGSLTEVLKVSGRKTKKTPPKQ